MVFSGNIFTYNKWTEPSIASSNLKSKLGYPTHGQRTEGQSLPFLSLNVVSKLLRCDDTLIPHLVDLTGQHNPASICPRSP
jgi:hypothetical protein